MFWDGTDSTGRYEDCCVTQWASGGMQVAGTEQGITEPEATFSACFGGAFLLWHPMKYASMLAEKMDQHGTNAWLVNTGWTGGR